jgi:hypothetical protein
VLPFCGDPFILQQEAHILIFEELAFEATRDWKVNKKPSLAQHEVILHCFSCGRWCWWCESSFSIFRPRKLQLLLLLVLVFLAFVLLFFFVEMTATGILLPRLFLCQLIPFPRQAC